MTNEHMKARLVWGIPFAWAATLFLTRPVIGTLGVDALGVEGAKTLWQFYWMILTFIAFIAYLGILMNVFTLPKYKAKVSKL